MRYLSCHKRMFSLFAVCCLLSLVFFGCSGGGSDGSASLSGDTGSIAFGVEWDDDSVEGRALAQTGPIDCAEVGVAEVQAEVYDDGGRLLASGGPWDCDLHSGTIDNVPAGSGRKVVVKGMSAEGREYYKGEVSGITVASGQVADAGMIEASAVIYVDGRWLQYRTFPDSSRNRYQAYIEYRKAGKPIDTSDISRLVLKDADGNIVQTRAPEVYVSEAYNTTYDAATGTVRLNQLEKYKDFSLYFPENITLMQGNYTFEATTARGEVVRETVFFPGRTELPTPDTTNFQYEWGVDGSLTFSWNNRSGDYDNISVYFGDQDWKDLCYLSLPADVEQVTFPADEIQKLAAFRNPISTNVLLRYRAIDEQDMNYARSYANTLQIPWNDITVDLLDYFPLTIGSTWIRREGTDPYEGVEYRTIEIQDIIDGIDVVKEIEHDGLMREQGEFSFYSYDSDYIYFHGTAYEPEYILERKDPPTRLKRFMSPGETFTTDSILYLPQYNTQFGQTYTWSLLGFEDVGMDDGYFPFCAKLQQVVVSEEPDSDYTSVWWLAKGVGVVMEESEEIEWDELAYDPLISASIPGHVSDISIPWTPSLQFRNYTDASKNTFQGWITLRKNGIQINEEDIVDVNLRRSDYSEVAIEETGFWAGPSYWGNWQPDQQRFDFSGPHFESGYYVRLPQDLELPPGEYRYEIITSTGNVVTYPISHPGKKEMPIPDAGLMNFEWLSDGSLHLSWANPAGEYDRFHVALWKGEGTDMFYATFDQEYQIEEMTIPAELVIALTKLYEPEAVNWSIKTRARTDGGLYYARGISDTIEIPWTRPTFTIPVASISIDGDRNDWANIQPAFVDEVDDEDPDADFAGADISELYLSKDNAYYYFMIRLFDGSPLENMLYVFWARQDQFTVGTPGDLYTHFNLSNGDPRIGVYQVDEQGQYVNVALYSQDYGAAGLDFVEWRVPVEDIGSLNNKYIYVYTHHGLGDPSTPVSDYNMTAIRLIDN